MGPGVWVPERVTKPRVEMVLTKRQTALANVFSLQLPATADELEGCDFD
jgi:hypothetical protein